jgi:hypothetical protein
VKFFGFLEKQGDFWRVVEKSMFWFNREFLSCKKGEKFSFRFLSTIFEHDVYICTNCAFYHFRFYFFKHQNIFYEFANVFIKGEIVKSKVFLIIIL